MNRPISSWEEFDESTPKIKKVTHDLHDYIDECLARNEIEAHEYMLLSRLYRCLRTYETHKDEVQNEITESNKYRIVDTISAIIDFTTGMISFEDFDNKISDLGHDLREDYCGSEEYSFGHTTEGKFFTIRITP